MERSWRGHGNPAVTMCVSPVSQNHLFHPAECSSESERPPTAAVKSSIAHERRRAHTHTHRHTQTDTHTHTPCVRGVEQPGRPRALHSKCTFSRQTPVRVLTSSQTLDARLSASVCIDLIGPRVCLASGGGGGACPDLHSLSALLFKAESHVCDTHPARL